MTSREFDAAIGGQLRALQRYRGVSQATIARKLRVQRVSLTRMLSGNQKLPLWVAWKFASIIGADLSAIIEDVVKSEPVKP